MAQAVEVTRGTAAIGDRLVTLMTRSPKKTLHAPMVLRIDQLNSKNIGSDAMVVEWSCNPQPG